MACICIDMWEVIFIHLYWRWISYYRVKLFFLIYTTTEYTLNYKQRAETQIWSVTLSHVVSAEIANDPELVPTTRIMLKWFLYNNNKKRQLDKVQRKAGVVRTMNTIYPRKLVPSNIRYLARFFCVRLTSCSVWMCRSDAGNWPFTGYIYRKTIMRSALPRRSFVRSNITMSPLPDLPP